MTVQPKALVPDRPVPLAVGAPSAARRYLAMPAFLVAVCALLTLWVSSLELDAIEAQRVNLDFIVTAVLQHLYLVVISTVIVVGLAVPVGIMMTRPFASRFVRPLLAIFNAGQAIPSVGVIILLALTLGFGPGYAITALVIYAFLPVLRNTMVGLEQVDASIIEAGRGMGMTKGRVLRSIELPLAVPVILAGVRTALVINVGTAAVATLTNAGGLGDIIYVGLIQSRDVMKITGGVLTGVLALLVDYIAGVAEETLRPRGL